MVAYEVWALDLTSKAGWRPQWPQNLTVENFFLKSRSFSNKIPLDFSKNEKCLQKSSKITQKYKSSISLMSAVGLLGPNLFRKNL